MEHLTINNNLYQVEGMDSLEEYNLIVYFCVRDGIKYIVYASQGDTDKSRKRHFNGFYGLMKIIQRSNILTPSLVEKDKKKGYIVQNTIDGDSVLKTLSEIELDSKIYEQLFDTFAYAKALGVNLEYDPRKFIIKEEKLFYCGYIFKPYKDKENLVNSGIRLWVYSLESTQLMATLGYKVDKTRLKPVAAVNKEIVMLVYQYYHI